MTIPVVPILLNALDFIALFICMGAMVCRIWVFPVTFFQKENVAAYWDNLIILSVLVLYITTLLLLMSRTAEMAGVVMPVSFEHLLPVLFNTHYGHVVILRFILLIMLSTLVIAAFRYRLQKPYMYYAMLFCIIWISFTCSASSHAADQGDFSIGQIIDWLHVLATAVWGGSILMLALVFFPNLTQALMKQKVEISRLMNNFSALTTIALCAVLITGFFNAMRTKIINRGLNP